jgi:hypothetical protein
VFSSTGREFAELYLNDGSFFLGCKPENAKKVLRYIKNVGIKTKEDLLNSDKGVFNYLMFSGFYNYHIEHYSKLINKVLDIKS